MHNTISIPSPLTRSSSFLLTGRASEVIRQSKAISLKTKGIFHKYFFKEEDSRTGGICDTIKLAFPLADFLSFHQIKKGIRASRIKAAGNKNSISLNHLYITSAFVCPVW